MSLSPGLDLDGLSYVTDFGISIRISAGWIRSFIFLNY